MYPENHFTFIIESLKKYEYPHINTMSEDKWPDIFAKANRVFLIGWILKRIDEKYALFIDGATDQKLADILHCQGLCTSVEKYNFMTCEMQNIDQIKILYRMFKLLDDINESPDLANESVSNEELKYYMDLDINLFPEYGAKNVISPAQRRGKILEYRAEIEGLKVVNDEVLPKEDVDLTDLKQQLQRAVEHLEMTYPGFKRKLHDLLGQAQFKSLDGGVFFKENFSGMIGKCAAESRLVLDYVRGLHSIGDFIGDDSTKTPVENDGRHAAFLREISELCDEVTSQRKH